MVTVSNLEMSFGGQLIFEDMSFTVYEKDKIGLAGKNGAGKSTLLKILYGEHKADSGSINIPKNLEVGYLSQDISHLKGKTVYDETRAAFTEYLVLKAELDKITRELQTRTDFHSPSYLELASQLQEMHEKVNLLGYSNIDKEIELVLMGLGFKREDLHRMVEEFSGGWQMRIVLAKLLLRQPGLILLDEPTNHLDIESIQWLEQFLSEYSGAVLLVSHDKAFLDAVTTRTLEISNRQLYDYKANYSKYLELRKERREKLIAARKNQDKYIEHTEMLINKFRAKKNKAKFAQTLISKLDKLEVVELDEEDLSKIKFTFPPAERSGKIVIEAKDLQKSYGDLEVLKGLEFTVMKGDRVAFVGKNGEGKSTLSRILIGKEPFNGHMKLGHNVNVGYYAQNQAEKLDGNDTVLETVDNLATGEMRSRIRSLLGAFLFSGDTVDKKVKVLSGGEKSRLALACLLLEPYNLLVLDEPTNHLDMMSKDMLRRALQDYQGTLIIVSHDRDFLRGLSNRVFEFTGGNIKEYQGDIYDFLEYKKILSLRELEKPGTARQEIAKPVKAASTESNKERYELRKELEKGEKKANRGIERSEKKIGNLENEIASIEDKLKDPAFYQESRQNHSIFENYEALKTKLSQEMKNWEELQLELESIVEQKRSIED